MKIHAHIRQKNGDDPTMEWLKARTGVITASEFDSLVTPLGKVKTGDGVDTFLCKKMAEEWQGGPLDSFQSFAMGQGVILEEQAIPFAEFNYDLKIRQVGFVTRNDGLVGCSPDGLVNFDERDFLKDEPTDYGPLLGGDDDKLSGIEIKCPILTTHIGYLLDGVLPKEYIAQVQGCMYVTGCATWHFLSYRRDMPPLHLVVKRDEAFQSALNTALEAFLKRFRAGIDRLIELNGGEPVRNQFQKPFRKQQPETSFDILP
jgi:hypothetical protein